MSYVRRIGLVGCLLATAIIGCSSSTSSVGTYGGVEPIPNETEDGGLITGNGEPSPMPMLAKIDPAGTMVQTPGEGVGVFTQYEPTSAADPGGHWYVWWTCDTDISNEACPFSIEINVESGALTSAMAEGFGANDVLARGGDGGEVSSAITATTTTTSTVQGVRFNTDPDAVITVSAALSGEYSGSFLFFVEDGKVNGGYTGTVTDPLQFQSTSP